LPEDRNQDWTPTFDPGNTPARNGKAADTNEKAPSVSGEGIDTNRLSSLDKFEGAEEVGNLEGGSFRCV
jgi:hypothetical protein